MNNNESLPTEQLRKAMRAWVTGIAIVTAAHQGERHGMTVSSFTSISLEPPLIMISLQTGSRTHDLVTGSNAFAVTILAEDQAEISKRFAGLIPDQDDRFEGLETETLVSGAPIITGGLAWLDCRVTQVIPAGTNTLFLAEVTAAHGDGAGAPLVYHDRDYRKIE